MSTTASFHFDLREDALLQRVGQGDGRALEVLYDRLSIPLYTVALSMLQNESAAAQLLEEVFLEIWHKAAIYQPDSSPAFIWILRELRLRALDQIRHQHNSLDCSDEDETFAAKAKSSPVAVEKAISADYHARSEEFQSAWRQLIDFQREAVSLAYFHGLNLPQLSDYLEEPIGAVKNRAYKGMARLREALRSYRG